MRNQIDDQNSDKVREYLRIIQERIIAPIHGIGINQSCTATLLLLFAAMDGLGKLLHSNNNAGANQRIRAFLDYIGGEYGTHKKELLDLRHSLVHNAINSESYMSRTEMSADQHLKKIGAAGFIYVNTTTMYQDFLIAFERFQRDIQDNQEMLRRAGDRLEWRQENVNYVIDPDSPSPTPPPPIEFILTR